MANYESLQSILEEAGMSNVVIGEGLSGAVDGSNTEFTTNRKPLTDSDYDDSVTVADVTVYVNGVEVVVDEVDAVKGKLTLQFPPEFGTEVTADYRYSPVLLTQVQKLCEEVQDLIDETMDGIDETPYTSPSATVRKITRYYAAGMLLFRDYGMNSDTALTSKDGDYKIKRAEGWLEKYAAIGGASGLTTGDVDTPIVASDDPLFGPTVPSYGVDDIFMRDL